MEINSSVCVWELELHNFPEAWYLILYIYFFFFFFLKSQMDLPVLDNDVSTLLRKFVKQIRSTRQHYLPLQVIR